MMWSVLWNKWWWWLTFGTVMFPRGAPPDAGLVLIQVKESDESLLLSLQFGHLSASLHGAHTPLHCRRAQGYSLFIKSQAASTSVGQACQKSTRITSHTEGACANQIFSVWNVARQVSELGHFSTWFIKSYCDFKFCEIPVHVLC